MTREFYKTGQSVPVTVVKMEKGRIIEIINEEKRGYKAVQVGFGKIKNSKVSKAMKGYFAKKNTEPKKRLKEFRVKDLENYKEGNELGLEIFKDVKFVDIRSTTIGKGFAGAMKRHNFAGLRASHGVSVSHRAHGSTGQNQDPGKVFKNKKMAGHMGSYGIGISRLVGAIIEASHDDKGIIWPLNIAPFKISIINLMIDDENCKKVADNFYNQLSSKFEILYDDRDCSIGKKLSDNDLIGIPYQIIIGKRDVKDNLVEFKTRQTNESIKISIDEVINIVSQKINL